MKCLGGQHDNPPGQKFCGDCGERLGALCTACGAAIAAGQRFCGDCGSPVAPIAAAGRFGPPDTYTPRHLAARILTSRSALEGERKQVTVLFADMKGSMELLADRDPEEAQRLVDPVLKRMMEAVHRYEGTVNQVMGDGIMALFGAPVAHEDHAVRACYAALRMQDAVRRYSEEIASTAGAALSIRVGINSGDVIVRAIGSDLYTDYSAVGQTTHLAARMEQTAPPGSILMTGSTARLAAGFVQVKPLGPIPIKGLHEPTDAFELCGAGPARTRLQATAARGLSPLVGRADELTALGRALETARAGHGQVVALVGDAGVGKSRLVWELTHSERTRDWLVLEAAATSYAQATPFFAMVELLKSYLGLAQWDHADRVRERVADAVRALDGKPDAAPALLGLLEALPDTDAFHALDPQERKTRTLTALAQLLLRESYTRPLLLIVEDLQWADSETLRCLDVLVAGLPGARLCLVMTYRIGYEHHWASKTCYSQLRIDALSPPDVDALLTTLIGDDPGLRPLRRVLIERTEGNPFFLEESVRMLADAGALTGVRGAHALAGGLPDLQIPETVQAVLASRIDRLPAREKRLLQSAAVIGKDIPLDLLQALTALPNEDVEESLSYLQSAELLYTARVRPDVESSFRHGLTHEVAYASLVLNRRRDLHARALEAMERLYGHRLADHVEALARHALGGEVWDKAVDYLRRAGTRAYRRGALRQGLDRYEQALDLLPRLAATDDNARRAIDVRLDLHAPLFSLGQIPRLTELYREAARLAGDLGDEPRLGRVFTRLSIYAFARADYAEAIAYAERAGAIAERTGDLELRIVTLYLLGTNHGALGDGPRHMECLRAIVDGPDADLAKRIVGLSASPYVLACAWLSSAFTWLGDPDRAEAYAERAVQAADDSDHPYAQAIAYTWRVLPVMYRGDIDEALSLCEGAVALCEQKELLGWLPLAYSVRGWILCWAGRPAEGLPLIERAIAMFEMVGFKAFLSLRYVEWAEGLLLAGRVDEARTAAQRGLELATTHGERGSAVWARCALGDIELTAGAAGAEVARAHYEGAREEAERMELCGFLGRCHLGLGRVEALGDDRARAREHLATAARLYRQAGSRSWLARVEAASARLD
jgi:class 3 adenylate cyclase/tetratricopeptide (TPR) repeat protein